jgi:hypothetical protein
MRLLLLVVTLISALYSAPANPAAPPKNSAVDFAFVLLAKAELPNPARVIERHARLDTKARALIAKTPKDTKKEPILEFNTPGNGTLFVLLVPAPVPKSEADDAAKFSVSSFRNGWQLPKHSAHLLVTLHGESDKRIDALVRFTRLLAAVSEASDAVGIYWGRAGATHDPKFFSDIVRELEPMLWLPLWTGVSIASEGPSRVSLLSLGMQQLGLPDLLLSAPKPQANDAIATFFDLLGYTASRGAAIPEGDTVGRSAAERLKVRYVPSPINSKERVWRVDLP